MPRPGPKPEDYVHAARHFYPELHDHAMSPSASEVTAKNDLGQTVLIHVDVLEQHVKDEGPPPRQPAKPSEPAEPAEPAQS